MAPCCENLALVEYTSATYNEEWQTYEDEQEHYGFANGDGLVDRDDDEILLPSFKELS